MGGAAGSWPGAFFEPPGRLPRARWNLATPDTPRATLPTALPSSRNFEYASGEDPVLGSALLPHIVDGIQQNVMSIVKHYIGNTQETERSGVNELVPEKLLMELYGPPFEAAVQHAAGVWVGEPAAVAIESSCVCAPKAVSLQTAAASLWLR